MTHTKTQTYAKAYHVYLGEPVTETEYVSHEILATNDEIEARIVYAETVLANRDKDRVATLVQRIPDKGILRKEKTLNHPCNW